MQLKKRYMVTKKKMAVGAMTLAMMASAVPAFAGNLFDFESDVKAGLRADLRTEQKLIRKELKDIRKDVMKFYKSSRKGFLTASASATLDSSERRACRKEAQAALQAELGEARIERDTRHKAALEAFQAALVKARAEFTASNTVAASASNTLSIGVRLEARLAYQAKLKSAWQAFADAKRRINADYHRDEEDARARLKAAADICLNRQAS